MLYNPSDFEFLVLLLLPTPGHRCVRPNPTEISFQNFQLEPQPPQAPLRPPGCPDLMCQRVKDAPEELACEVQLFLRGDPEVGPACGEAVVLPAALVVVGEELRAETQREA